MNMTRLKLKGLENVKSSGMIELASSPYVKNIEFIDLRYTKIDDAGIMAIANSSNFISLREINLEKTPKINSSAIVFLF